ncbi:MAG: elongation factor P [Parcubacteria group bacterium]
MLSSLSEIKKGVIINVEGEPCAVVEARFVRMQQRKPVMQTKLKNLSTGKILEINYHPGDRVEAADLERRTVNYLYKDADQAHFMDNSSFETIDLQLDIVGDAINFVKEGTEVSVVYFKERPISVSVLPKVELKVIETPPGVKGDSVSNATKPATVETGFIVNVPLFVKEGDVIRINTDTGEYVERV